MHIIKRICVVGRIEDEKNTKFSPVANDLGRAIATRKSILCMEEEYRVYKDGLQLLLLKREVEFWALP